MKSLLFFFQFFLESSERELMIREENTMDSQYYIHTVDREDMNSLMPSQVQGGLRGLHGQGASTS